MENLPGVGVGSAYVQAAIDTLIPGAGPVFVAIAIFLFAFTTLIALGFTLEANISDLMGDHPLRKAVVLVGRIICMVIIFASSLSSVEVAWNMADIGVGLMAWTNLVAMVLLQNLVVKALRDYEGQKKLGLDPVFDPEEMGIENAELWKEIVQEHYGDLVEKKQKAYSAGADSARN